MSATVTKLWLGSSRAEAPNWSTALILAQCSDGSRLLAVQLSTNASERTGPDPDCSQRLQNRVFDDAIQLYNDCFQNNGRMIRCVLSSGISGGQHGLLAGNAATCRTLALVVETPARGTRPRRGHAAADVDPTCTTVACVSFAQPRHSSGASCKRAWMQVNSMGT